jgi:hypothetical protein
MGSSAKKKKEKKKDFQKTKLKVGKAKAKASNFTDTSFKSKGTVLRQVVFPGLELTIYCSYCFATTTHRGCAGPEGSLRAQLVVGAIQVRFPTARCPGLVDKSAVDNSAL